MIPFPQINPVAISLGPLQVRWYGLMYILAFTVGIYILRKRVAEMKLAMSDDDLTDFAFYLFAGVLLGGRLGYILFYNLPFYVANPLEIFVIWRGGMAFHGGFVGTIVAGWLFSRRRNIPFFALCDAMILAVPIGLGLGRLGNFINGELWGRVTDVPWAMVFPADPTGELRHPSPLYQFGMEGILIFSALFFLRKVPMAVGGLFWAFIGLYGLFRLIGERFREPDPQLSYILPHVTMGMVLSLPMLLVGTVLFVRALRNPPRPVEPVVAPETAPV